MIESLQYVWLVIYLFALVSLFIYGMNCYLLMIFYRLKRPQARRQHEPLLRASHSDVNTPLVISIIDGRERRNGIHHEQGRVAGTVHRLPDFRYPGGNTGRRFIVNNAYRFVLVIGIRC